MEQKNNFLIVVLVPVQVGDSANVKSILSALEAASYGEEGVDLDIVFAQSSTDVNFNRVIQRIYDQFEWTHGKMTLRPMNHAGYYDLILDAWQPTRKDMTQALIIDSARANPPAPQFYQYLQYVRTKYKNRLIDVAGFAFEPVPILTRMSDDRATAPTFSNITVPLSMETGAHYMYQALSSDSAALVPANADVWRLFQNWFASRRSEWFLWPEVVAPSSKKDPTWKNFKGTMRAHWTLWFTRFCAEQELFVLYPKRPLSESVLHFAEGGKWPAMRSPLMYNYAGRAVVSETATSAERIRRILELGASTNGSISMTVVSKAFINTARSWVCNVDVAGIRPPGIVWITTDEASRDAMKAIPQTETVYLSELGGDGESRGTSYGTPGYWLLMMERTRLIRDILNHGVGVFAFETDQIWLEDPVPHVMRLVHGGDAVDVVGTMDTRKEIGGNFLYLNPTRATILLWREVCRRFEASYWSSGQAHRSSSRQFIENDQSLLTRLVFYDEGFKRRNSVSFRALDTDLFVDGRWYEYPRVQIYGSMRARAPVLINNNFIIGIDRKRERAIEQGHWFYADEEGNKTDASNLDGGGGTVWDGSRCLVDRLRKAVAENRKRASLAGGGVARPVPQFDLEAPFQAAVLAIQNERKKK